MRKPRSKAAPPAPESMVEDAIEAILVYYTTIHGPINEHDLVDRSRDAYTIKVRAVVMHFMKTECHWSYPAIGARFERDHTSVIHLVRRAHHLVDQDEMDDVYDYVRTRVANQMLARREALLKGVS